MNDVRRIHFRAAGDKLNAITGRLMHFVLKIGIQFPRNRSISTFIIGQNPGTLTNGLWQGKTMTGNKELSSVSVNFIAAGPFVGNRSAEANYRLTDYLLSFEAAKERMKPVDRGVFA